MPHINHRRGETRRSVNEYPYSDAGFALFIQTQANVARRHEGRRLAFAALASYEADQAQAAADAIEAANVEREANIETEGPMRLWTVTRTDAIEYDQYSMFVVAAPTADLARRQSPSDYERWDSAQRCFVDNHDGEIVRYTSWTQDIDSLTVTEIGSAVEGTVSGTVLCASFNAG
jgi:hypothetical protein